jgi:hypothetical protein
LSRYTDLITSQHAARAKFSATIEALTQPALDLQAVMGGFPADYDLDSAVGAQLDVVGEWVGQSRFVVVPLDGVYFAFNTDGVGFNQGYWLGRYDPTTGSSALPDEAYRALLKATVALNHWDGTVPAAAAAIAPLFPDNAVYIQDRQDMSISVAVGGPPLDRLLSALLTGGYLALKAATVRIDFTFTSFPPLPVFGFGADNEFIGGFNHGAWGVPDPVVEADL